MMNLSWCGYGMERDDSVQVRRNQVVEAAQRGETGKRGARDLYTVYDAIGK
jgi:hypothetical protein